MPRARAEARALLSAMLAPRALRAGAPVIASLFSAVIIAWIASVNKLNVLFKAKLKERSAAQPDES